MKKINYQKPLILNILLLNTMIYFSWFIAEIGLRIIKSNQVYTESTGINKYFSLLSAPDKFSNIMFQSNIVYVDKKNEFSYSYHTNSIGLFDKKKYYVLNKKNNNKIRILCLGDSFTQGIGAPYDSSWTRTLENILNKDTAEKYELLNAGVSAFDPFYSYYLYHTLLIDYKPDIILLAVNFTDLTETNARGGFERFKADGSITYKKRSKFEWLFATSYLTRLFMINVLKYSFQFEPIVENSVMFNTAIKKLKDCFYLFNLEKKIYHYNFIPIFHPLKGDFYDNGFPTNDFYNWYKNHFSNNCINLYKSYNDKSIINKNNLLKYYWNKDGHHNSLGYNVFAKEVYLKLKEMGVFNQKINK